MPTDNRRIQGPEISNPYILFTKSYSKSRQEYAKDILNKEDRRKDGRTCDDQRKVCKFVLLGTGRISSSKKDLKSGVVSQAKGSAYIELNNTKVICSVFDPREIPNRVEYSQHGELYCVLKYAPFSCLTRRAHQQDAEEKELSLSLRRALEPVVCRHEFPNFQVDVYALILQNDGSALAAAITCAGLALADAHVPMYDLVTACSLGVYGNHLLLDPTAEEESVCEQGLPEIDANHGMVTLTVMGAHFQISQVWQTGCMASDCLSKGVEELVKACQVLYPLAQRCLVKSVVDTIANKEDTDDSQG